VKERKKKSIAVCMGKPRHESRSDKTIPARFDILKFVDRFEFCFKLDSNWTVTDMELKKLAFPCAGNPIGTKTERHERRILCLFRFFCECDGWKGNFRT
jgi:hypothetical protein